MKVDIGVGKAGAPVLIDLDMLRDGRLLVAGVSRSGKSWLIRRLLEQAWGAIQEIVIDVEGEFVTLGDTFGHHVIDAAALERVGARAAAIEARRHRISLVVDLSAADRDSQAVLATDFLRGLVECDSMFWTPALVVVDEAHLLAPQGASSGTPEYLRKPAVAAVTDLMARGSKRGLCGVVAVQRTVKVAKSVVAEALNVAIGRTTMDLDVRRAGDLLGLTRVQSEALRRLRPGEFMMLGDAVGDTVSGRAAVVAVGPVESVHRGKSPAFEPPPPIAPEQAAAIFASLPDAEPDRNAADDDGAAAAADRPRKRPRRPGDWTEAEIQLLRDGVAAGRKRDELIRELGRSTASVYTKISNLGLKGPKAQRDDSWTAEEIAVLRDGYAQKLSRRAIKARLPDPARRSISAIGYIAGELGLKQAPDVWTDEEVATMRRMIEDEGADRNAVAAALGRLAGGVSSMMTKHGLKSRPGWQPAEYDLLRRRHAEGARLVDIARELDRPYMNVAKIAQKRGLRFAAEAQANRQPSANRPVRVSRDQLLALAREQHALVESSSGGFLVDGMYSYSFEQLVALVNRDRAKAGQGPVAAPPDTTPAAPAKREAEKREAAPAPSRKPRLSPAGLRQGEPAASTLVAKVRKCLTCGTTFKSEWAGNRQCNRCRNRSGVEA